MHKFVEEVLKESVGDAAQNLFDKSLLLQYLDSKMGAVYGDSKTRRCLANIYAIYSILYFYEQDFYGDRAAYQEFEGYEYMRLFRFYRGLYGGTKLQNHALNSRVNGEFLNKLHCTKEPIVINNGKYALHIDYLYVEGFDISRIAIAIIEKYVSLLIAKDHQLESDIAQFGTLNDVQEKKTKLAEMLGERTEARIFEIISYAILKCHYKNINVYFGFSREELSVKQLMLYKTGRTNANDGGIDFVMRPLGRFFQVTEVNNYDKYLLDIDKVMHFPVTFVIKTLASKEQIENELEDYIAERSGGMAVVEKRYKEAIEEIITINELLIWVREMDRDAIDSVFRDIDIYYRLEMNLVIDDDDLS